MPAPSTTTNTPTGSLTAELGALVDEFMSGVTARIERLADCGTNRELIDVVQNIERAVRAAGHASAAVVAAVERRGLYHVDGHADAKSWMRAGVRTHPDDVVRAHRVGRLGREFPQVAEALASGHISLAHANKLAQVWSNRRISREFADNIDVALWAAATKPFKEFALDLDDWARLTDQDGGHRDRDESHSHRDVRFLTVGEVTLLRGQLYGVQAEIAQQIFEAFLDAEYRYDVDQAKATDGDDWSPSRLPRTPQQRRSDALLKLFEAAATAPLNGSPIKVTVDIVIDQETFEEQLLNLLDPLHRHRSAATMRGPVDDSLGAAGPTLSEHVGSIRLDLAGDQVDSRDPGVDADDSSAVPPAPTEAEQWITAAVAAARSAPRSSTGRPSMCRTTRGTPVDPADAVVAALLFRVRRVVIDGQGVLIDLGKRNALFTGSAREAAFLQAAIDGNHRCIWPACGRPARQIDHTIPRCEGGVTAPHNSGPMCARHNLFKIGGYRTRRDASGIFHLYRTDGSEVIAI